jgi:multidrug resistance efflux pump
MRPFASAVAVLLVAGCFAAPRDRGTLRVRRGDFANDLLLTGEMTAPQGSIISVPRLPQWQTSIKWLAADGIEAKAGDRIVELDNAQFASVLDAKQQAVVQAQQQLAQKDGEWSADFTQKQLDADRKKVDYDKTKLDAAVPPDIVSGREYDDRQIKYKRATVEYQKASAVLRAAREGGNAERANLLVALSKAERELRDAEQAIDSLTLRAPRSGIVVIRDHPWEGRKLQQGDPAWVGLPIAVIPEVASLEVDAALADVDDGRVSVGMPATIILDAYPSLRFSGKIVEISAVAQESARASMRRAFRVKVKLDAIDAARMRPGQSARVVVHREAKRDVLLVPRTALDFSGKSPRAHVDRDTFAGVTLGSCNAHDCILLGGLNEGDHLAPLVSTEVASE